VTMLPGHGIGPEMMACVKEVFRHAAAPVDFEEVYTDDTTDITPIIKSVQRNGVAIKGNIEHKTKTITPGGISRNVELRRDLDLFAYVMECKSQAGVKCRHSDIDMVIVRQNTEGEYAMQEHESVSGVVESLKVVTKDNSERIAHYAFGYALKHGRKKVTAVHKANIMKLSDGLFLETCRKVSQLYPSIEFNDMIVDNCCMQVVSKPQQFDVVVMGNLYGSVVSNVVCGLIGGPGLLSGINVGHTHAVFEPGTRMSGDELVGKNCANPVAMLNSSCDLLTHLNLKKHSQIIHNAVNRTINEDKIHTPDLGGQHTTSDMMNNVIGHIKESVKEQMHWR